ncbi:MAG: hypothetical protein JNN23_09405, partial [Chryseobacterium gambrini]|nr:hypothetical protein [Chryseobacterium gambrini]
RLLLYLNDGYFEHRTVSGWGYSMRVKSKKELFLHNDFTNIWQQFKNLNEEKVFEIFEETLKSFFKTKVLKHRDNPVELDILINDIRSIGHYERVLLWSILEYLSTDRELFFDKNIAQYWEYPNLIALVNEDNTSVSNDYRIGNLLLGTSYTNNKSGGFDYSPYPLMKGLNEEKSNITPLEIDENTEKINLKLKTLL